MKPKKFLFRYKKSTKIVESCKIYFVEKRKFIYYYKKGFDKNLICKGAQKMKIEEKIYKYEGLKRMINYKDIFNWLISIIGIIVSNIQLVEVANHSDDDIIKIVIYDILIW